jgi:hypothetical protein
MLLTRWDGDDKGNLGDLDQRWFSDITRGGRQGPPRSIRKQ